MARINTLANFLTDVANAIRSKTGKTGKITPANFDVEINDITTGSGTSEDLTSELNTYNSLLTTQEGLLIDIKEVLDEKTSGSEEEEEIILPAGYSLLPRIISSGNQYIKTGILPTDNTGFEIDFETTDKFEASGNARTLFGSRGVNYWKNAYQFSTYTTASDGDIGGVFAVVRTSIGFCANGGASRIGRYNAVIPSVCILIDSYLLGIDVRCIILANVGHLANRRAGVIYSQLTHVVMSEWLAAFRNDAAG